MVGLFAAMNYHLKGLEPLLYAIQRGGIVKVGFLTEPDHGVRGVRQ